MTTLLEFHGTSLELPSPLPAHVELAKDGSMVLSFTNFTGVVTVRPCKAGQPETEKAGSAIPETTAGGSANKAPAKGKGKGRKSTTTTPSTAKEQPPNTKKDQEESDDELTLMLAQVDEKENDKPAAKVGGKKKKEEQEYEEAVASYEEEDTTIDALSPTVCSNSAEAKGSSSSTRKKARREVVCETPVAPKLAPRKFGAPPQGRWGHTATMIGPNRMVIYGGEGDDTLGKPCTFGDLYCCDLGVDGSVRWEKPINCDSIPRTWHSSTFLADKNLMVAFGGERMGPGGVAEVLDDIMVLDTELFLWYPPAISGKPPSARSGHTASLVGQDLIVFGGSRGRGWQNNVCVLDVERWHWRAPHIAGSPPPGRSYHSAVVIPLLHEGEGGQEGRLKEKEDERKPMGSSCNQHQAMVVYFGGNDGTTCFDTVHVLKVGVGERGRQWEWFHPEVVGSVRPEKRTGHAACLLEDGKSILIQGGWDPQDETRDDTTMYENAFLLDTQTWEWRALEGGREGSSLLADKALFPSPGVMVGHTAVLAQARAEDEEGPAGERTVRVLMFGGQDPKGTRREDLFVVKE